MDTSKTAISFKPEPPLREGQFLRSPVLHRGQALRALAVVALVSAVAALLGLRPARAETLPVVEFASAGTADAQRFVLAQMDLSKTRRNATKKKTREMP
jgi:hypothetical protein